MDKIYIVAGHGQGDPGAVANGCQEADVTRRIAKDLKSRLSNMILYPTERNLYKTKDYSYFDKGSYVLEIHLNSAINASATGTELLIKTGFNADATDRAIYNALTPFFTARGIKSRNDLGNMNNLASRGVGYSLLEVCFINNANDMKVFEANYIKIIDSLVTALAGNSSNITVPITPAAVPNTNNTSSNTQQVKVSISNLRIRKAAGTNSESAGYCPVGVYTIVEKKAADGYTWGKLKSGIGWIALEYTNNCT